MVHHLEEAHSFRCLLHLGDEPGSVAGCEVDDRYGQVVGFGVHCREGLGRVVEDGWDSGDAGIDEAFDAGLGVVEGREGSEALMVRDHGLIH